MGLLQVCGGETLSGGSRLSEAAVRGFGELFKENVLRRDGPEDGIAHKVYKIRTISPLPSKHGASVQAQT